MSSCEDRMQVAVMQIDEALLQTIDGRTIYPAEEMQNILLDLRLLLQTQENP